MQILFAIVMVCWVIRKLLAATPTKPSSDPFINFWIMMGS